MVDVGVQRSEPNTVISAIEAPYRIGILIAMLAAAVAGLFFLEPVSQSAAYHGFIDTRSWLGIPNFGDVVSNLPVRPGRRLGTLAGVWPRGSVHVRRSRRPMAVRLLFVGVGLVSVGSAYYHAAPDNGRLFWDRLPMTVAFMALFSMLIADRIHRRAGVQWLLPILVVAGAASVLYWDWSEASGRGDLRFYLLVQSFPIVALPVICWLFPEGRYTRNRHLAWMIAWYALAKVLETFDRQVFALLGDTVSGHSLKHLAASVAVLMVVRMLAASRRS